MGSAPEVTFFMLVTDPCALIADYAIRSYRLLAHANVDFRLRVYGNCLSPLVRDRYFPRWGKLPYVELDDNRAHVTDDYPHPDYPLRSPEGIEQRIVGNWEGPPTIWDRELRKLHSPFVATVDADFEILDSGFVVRALERLRSSANLAGISSDYSPDRPEHNETYSRRTVFMHQQWHTWFCIYRKNALDIDVSSYYFEKISYAGAIHIYDAFSYLQHALLAQGWRFEAVAPECQNQFLHYTSFGQNQTVTARTIAAYRRYRILLHRGIIPRLGFKGARGRLNRWVGYGVYELFMRRFGGVDRARQQFQHLENPDFDVGRLYRD